MNIENTYKISTLDRAMAQQISTHTGITEVAILRSIVISKEHVRIVRIRAMKEGRIGSDGFPIEQARISHLRYAQAS